VTRRESTSLRILYVSRENAPGDHGGAVHTWQVASLLAGLGHQVCLLCHRRPGEPREEARDGVTIRRANMALRGRSLPLLALPSLAAYRRSRFDVAMERFDTFGGLASIYARLTSTPLLLEVNYPHLEEMTWKWQRRRSPLASLRPVHRLLERWNLWQYAQADAAIAPRTSIVPSGHRHKVELVHWGANTDHFRPPAEGTSGAPELRRQLELEGRRVVVSHGSFQPWHGTEGLPDIIARAVARAGDVAFLLVGRGAGIQEVERRVRERGLERFCRFPGHVSHDEVPRYLGLADVALAPFDNRAYEPLERFGFFWSPAKIFEYMACGLPVVTTDQDYLQQVVEGSGAGVCLPQNDTSAIAEGLLRVLEDPAQRRRMGRAGRRAVIERFSWQAHVEQLAGILQGLSVGRGRHCEPAAP